MRLAAEIALKGATFAFDRLYTYAIPPEFCGENLVGRRVLVPFGRANTKKQGIILRLVQSQQENLKQILSITDREPVINAELIKLCEYMHETLFCTYYDAVQSMLPPAVSYKLVESYSLNSEFSGEAELDGAEREILEFLRINGTKTAKSICETLSTDSAVLSALEQKGALVKSSDMKRKVNDATRKWIRLKLSQEELDSHKLTPRQSEVARLLADISSASVKEICYFTGVSTGVLDNLVKRGIAEYFEKEIFRTPFKTASADGCDISLTEEQQSAFEGLLCDYKSGDKTALLYGVTGSGKTQVFLKLVDAVFEEGRGVIVMVPEISLTPQMISIFTARYGDKVAVFHSAMSMGQRLDEWKRIRQGKAKIAVGTRTAVFAPFEDLGLIIIDEEQEHTYKSEKNPKFHARDIARFRMKYHKGLLCLASATPSVESFTLAKSGKYSLYRLTQRYGEAVLPEVITVDMKAEIEQNGNKGVVSQSLCDGIREALDNKNQVILLLNRRGYNTYIACPSCNTVAVCPQCSISLTYHSANDRLMCHYCGYSVKASQKCPECNSEHMKFSGIGTQKAEQELKALFPDARILRLDADSTMARDSYSQYLSDFADRKYDILLGTQMVAKGLDFANVTLVGVLGADGAENSDDYRSFERSFSLLTQVVGRAGRGQSLGRAIIQTRNPENNIIELAKNQDYESFYDEEILTRRLMVYPPYCDICVVSTSCASQQDAREGINLIFEEIKALISTEFSDVKLIILGPVPATVVKVNNRYRYKMIIKCKNNARLRQLLRRCLEKYPQRAVSVDFNPETII